MQKQNQIYGNSPELLEVLRTAELVAVTDVPVLVTGETGTGKEILARSIHAKSLRRDKPFVTINCATLPETLAESLFFGHRQGAFTGANSHQKGLIAGAAGGTLLLDEVGEIPLAVQAKLLRFLENGECQPLGCTQTHHYDVRIIAATNRDLASEVGTGNFRRDLFYRLNVVPLELPSLRKRTGDLKVLLHLLTGDLARQHQLAPPEFTRAAQKQLECYGWPGNIRELRNFCERMLVLFSGRRIDVTNLPGEIQREQGLSERLLKLPLSGISIESLEIELIQQALQRTRGNKSRAARLLGLSRDTLLYRLKKYAISV